MARLKWVSVFLLLGLGLHADEGMWTFDNPPLAQMKEKYGFAPDEKWLEHVRLSALEFGSGSGAFVSKDGLVMTNHHVGLRWIEKVSEPGGKDYARTGFVAKTRADEIRIPDLRVYTLMKMVNVTDKVNEAVKQGMDEKAATKARMEKLTKLRDDLDTRDGLRVWEVSLYQGGEYWLYAYKVHSDVRLVMAPEAQIAFFGGDADNFMYPRHDLDFALFRVYEGGGPYHPPHFLRWSGEGLQPGDLTVVVGRPGRTRRLDTIAQMKFQRDVTYPHEVAAEERQRAVLVEYGKISPEHARKVASDLFFTENEIKRGRGYLDGLMDPVAFGELERRESEQRTAVAKDPKLQAEAGQSWARVEEATEQLRPMVPLQELVNSRKSKLLKMALDVVRCVQELDRPTSERLEGYRSTDDADYAKWRIQRVIPFDNLELETLLIQKNLEEIQRQLEPESPFRKAVLGEKTPAELAKEVVAGTKVPLAYARRDFVGQGAKKLAKSQDPLIRLALAIEPFARDMAKKREDMDAIVEEHRGRIARARFSLYGKSRYPDATGTLRFSYGKVSGYREGNADIQPFTTFGDLYARASEKGPEAGGGAWALPERWHSRRAGLDLKVSLNFCHTTDIVGGNSGSPVISEKGEFVGIVFDGNLQSLPGAFYYDEKVNRTVSVDARAIIEALAKVYDGKHLVDELLTR